MRTLNGIVFGHLKIRSSPDLHDPCNLFFSSVLSRREGYCVGIASVYLVLAGELGVPIRAVATPSHVFLRYDDGVYRINIETGSGGSYVPDERYVETQRIAETSVRRGIFMRALTSDQFIAQMWSNLGVIYSERGDHERASDEYAAALQLDRRLPAAWYNLGKDRLARGDLKGAIRSFSRALHLHPNDTWALNNRGLTYRRLGKESKARSDFQAAQEIDPAYTPPGG